MVNTIDKPGYCTVQFGSIVNKSPLVIGISTSGAAPVLAQHVRSLLEASLPSDIHSLAQHAARIRARVNGRLGTSLERRKYWSAFFGKAFGFRTRGPAANGSYVIKTCDIEDLMLRDLRVLQSANTVYIAAGANADIAKLARREVVRLKVDIGNGQNELGLVCCNSVVICN